MYATNDIIIPDAYDYPKGALRVHSWDGETLTAHPEGGGFMYKFNPDEIKKYNFRVVDTTQLATRWRKAKFCIDDGPEFEGYHWGHRWNGWACPQFTIEVMREIAEWINKDSWAAITIGDDGTITTTVDDDFPEVDEGDERERHGIPTARLYGFSGWCWDVVEEEEEPTIHFHLRREE